MNKRVLLTITGALNIGGGIAKVNQLVLSILSDEGYKIDVLSLSETPGGEIAYNSRNVVTYKCFANKKLDYTLAVWRHILSHDYDFVFCDHVNLASILAPLSALGLTRYLVHVHGDEVFPDRLNFEGRLGLRGAWKCSASSAFSRDCVLIEYPKHPVIACPLGLDPIQSQRLTDGCHFPIIDSLSLTAIDGSVQKIGASMILIVGRLSAQDSHKGHDVLIEAMPKILETIPSTQLVIAGKGDDMDRLLSLAHSQAPDAQHAIFMPGFVPDSALNILYQRCVVFAMPSWAEGFGLVYLEAMSWGKACLASSVDAAREIVRHRVTGWLVDDPKSVTQVTHGLLELLSDQTLTQQMGRASLDLVKEHYLYNHFKKRFLDLLYLKP